MRKLIVRAFNISLDGVSAEYGTAAPALALIPSWCARSRGTPPHSRS